MTIRHFAQIAIATALMTFTACADDPAGAGDGGTGGDGSGGDGASGDGGLGVDGHLLADGAVVTQCTDGIDNDGDGRADGLDPECTGGADDDESTYGTGIPGDNRDPMWQDCFFDGNSGAGDDRCRYRTECLTGELPSTDADCAVSQACIDFCERGVPNGCDCFGCCEVYDATGTPVNVVLGGTCSQATLSDTSVCPRCTPTTLCDNPCGHCELCPGRTVADLPADCFPPDGGTWDGGVDDMGTPTPVYGCDNGEQVCSDTMPCPVNYTCQLGCCLPLLF